MNSLVFQGGEKVMEMDFEKKRKEIIRQLEDIRDQLTQSLDVLEKFKAKKIQEAKARRELMNKLVSPNINSENISDFNRLSPN
jgi:hypothetical protein